MWKTYYSPHSLEETLWLLAKNQGNARLIAGGTDLIVELEQKTNLSAIIIDISRIPDLDHIRLDEQGQVHLGPLVTHNQVVGSQLCQERAFPLAKACWSVGSPQIRNRGTVAGNLASASPANDTITPLWALEASVTLQSTRGRRTLSFPEFFIGPKKAVVQPDEMIIDISFPAMSQNQVGTFRKLGLRKSLAISVVNVAVLLEKDGDSISKARITLGSVAQTIIRAEYAEQYLVGKRLSADVINQAGELAAKSSNPISDIRGSAEYRRHLTNVETRSALEELANGQERESIPARPVMLWGRTNGHLSQNKKEQSLVHSRDNNEPIITVINGEIKTVYGANHLTLLQMLREKLGLTGGKEGCAEGECGACTMLMDGIAILACMTPAPQAHGRQVVTIEGLAQGDELNPIQEAFSDQGAVQCGYCTPGVIMSGVALTDEIPSPTRDEIKQAFSGNICRCTGYYPFIKAIESATKAENSHDA